MKQKLLLALSVLVVMFSCALVVTPLAMVEEGNCSVLPDSLCGPDAGGNGIMGILKLGIQILSAGVGVVAVGAFIWAGILYASAGDSAESVSKAKDMMKNTAIGLVVFGVMFLALNWLIPGGVFTQ